MDIFLRNNRSNTYSFLPYANSSASNRKRPETNNQSIDNKCTYEVRLDKVKISENEMTLKTKQITKSI
jgi:hypothetical protein